jgi:hypothetical protein
VQSAFSIPSAFPFASRNDCNNDVTILSKVTAEGLCLTTTLKTAHKDSTLKGRLKLEVSLSN